MGEHVRAMLDLQRKGAVTFDYGNNIRAEAQKAGVEDAFDFPGFVPAYIRPLFCEGKGPFRWAVLSGDPDGPRRHRRRRPAHVPARTRPLARWITLARERVKSQGLPARICWLGYGERAKMGLVFNDLVRTRRGEGAHRHRPRPPRRGLGGLAQPRDGGDERRLRRRRRLADPERAAERGLRRDLGLRPPRRRRGHGLLDPRRAWWWSRTGPPEAAARLQRVLTTDPGTGVMRHADAGYERAVEVARQRGVQVPMLDRAAR